MQWRFGYNWSGTGKKHFTRVLHYSVPDILFFFLCIYFVCLFLAG